MTRGIRILFLLMILAASAPAALAQTTMTWTVDGVQREALVFASAPLLATNVQPVPLVFAFHGHGGTMKAASQVMHLQTLWPGAVIVYPQGLKTPSQVDPQGNFPGWQVRAGQAGLNDRDLKFFDAMLATMRQKFPVDLLLRGEVPEPEHSGHPTLASILAQTRRLRCYCRAAQRHQQKCKAGSSQICGAFAKPAVCSICSESLLSVCRRGIARKPWLRAAPPAADGTCASDTAQEAQGRNRSPPRGSGN